MSGVEKRQRGAALARRREALRLSQNAFAEESEIHRDQVRNVEIGTAHGYTFAQYERDLERLERQRGGPQVDASNEEGRQVEEQAKVEGQVKVELAGSFGVRISAEGSRGDVDHLLRVSVAELVNKMSEVTHPQRA